MLETARGLRPKGGSGRAEAVVTRLEEVDPAEIPGDPARIAFWINLYNAILLREMRSRPRSGTLLRQRRLFRRTGLQVGAHEYSLDVIEHGLLRGNRRPPYSPRRLLRSSDPRLASAPGRPDRRVHFALNCGARSCPPVRSYQAEELDHQLETVCRSYLLGEAVVDRDGAAVKLPGLMKLYRHDFGSQQEQLELLAKCLPGDQSSWLSENTSGVRVSYSRFDWTIVAGGAE